jgi:hypothetical protein
MGSDDRERCRGAIRRRQALGDPGTEPYRRFCRDFQIGRPQAPSRRQAVGAEEAKASDEATVLVPVYPTWFIERLVDANLEKALVPG